MVIGTTTQTLKLNVEKQLKKHVETILNMILGLKKSRKNQAGGLRLHFFDSPPGIFRFFTLPLQDLIYTKTATGFRTLLSYIKIIQSFTLIQNTKKQV